MESININNSEYCVGNTPLVLVQSLTKKLGLNVWAKLEGCNPGQSIKDRVVSFMLERAEMKGDITRGKSIIVEATSGNTGHSLAMIASNRGYKSIIVTKESCSIEKRKLIKLLGGELVVCGNVSHDHRESYYETAKRIAASTPNGYYLNQNFNELNYLAHYTCLGPEILEQMGENKIDYLIASCSTGGTISGLGRALKAKNKHTKIFGADCCGSALSNEFYGEGTIDKKTLISGLGKDIVPANFRKEYIDEMVVAEDYKSIKHIHDLAINDGILAGGSAGATIEVLLKKAKHIPAGSNVILIFADHGSKYLDSYFNDDWLKANFADKGELVNVVK